VVVVAVEEKAIAAVVAPAPDLADGIGTTPLAISAAVCSAKSELRIPPISGHWIPSSASLARSAASKV